MFGSGVIGQVTAPQILKDHGLLEYIDCYIDNDKDKWGRQLEVLGRLIDVESPDHLDKCSENTTRTPAIGTFSDNERIRQSFRNK